MNTNNQKHYEDPLVELAWNAITAYVEEGHVIEPRDLPGNPKRAGCFVSIHSQPFDDLRGCIGTIGPTRETLAEEVIYNAMAAATEDPRFPPITPGELDDLTISVDVLMSPVAATYDELDPSRYGVIVTQGSRRGLLLPDLEGVDTVDVQLTIACQKAGINPNSNYKIEKFEVVRHA